MSTLPTTTIGSSLNNKGIQLGSTQLQPAQLENCTLYERDGCHGPPLMWLNKRYKPSGCSYADTPSIEHPSVKSLRYPSSLLKQQRMHDAWNVLENSEASYQHSFSQLNPLHILSCIYICRSHGDFHKFHLGKYQDLMHIHLYLDHKKKSS